MRPMKVRTHLLLLTLGSLLPLVILAAAAGWMLATGAPVLAQEMILLIAAGTLGAIVLSALLSIQLARRISGPLAWVTATVKALRTNDPVDRPAAAIRVREIDEASRALAEAVQAARSRETSLRRADRVKDEFFAMLSHELRNPLGALAAASQILGRTGSTDPAANQAIEVVARQVEQMTRLVEDLLDISRVTRGKLSLTRRPVNLAEVTEAAVRAMHASGQLDRHELRLELSTAWVHADEARLAQIVSNLVGNAVKFTPEAGEITVRVQREGQTALLRVKDSGIGMSPELAQRVFDLFVQGEQSRGGGLGIGLTLVKHLAELQGGQAFAASGGPGQGSVFTVSLPVTETSATVQVRPAAQPAKRSRHRIVLIEDNDDARRTLMTALSMDGHEVFEAADGDAGIRTVAQVKPDVAIVDVGLPGLNGYQVAQRLRARQGDDNMVLIALTGFGQPDSLRRAHEAGFDEYVTKPIAPERLVRLMDVALAARVRRRSTPGIPTLNSPSARA